MLWGGDAQPRSFLTEAAADNEHELQELIKDSPGLIPAEELGLPEPLLVIGRETTLPAGSVDLVALARTGDIVIVEFKTGTGNPDFRAALAQMIDYGSDMWRMTFDDFERAVPLRYFASAHCTDTAYKSSTRLIEACHRAWDDLTEEEASQIAQRVELQLASGAFTYVLIAQNFSPSIENAVDYLNVVTTASFYGVELVRFDGDGTSAFEARVVLRPSARTRETKRSRFPDEVEDPEYRDVLRTILDEATAVGCRIVPGVVGLSIKMPVPARIEPLSVAWMFPPTAGGWLGLTDLTLGFDRNSARSAPDALPDLDWYVETALAIAGASPAKPSPIAGATFPKDVVIRQRVEILRLIRDLKSRLAAAK